MYVVVNIAVVMQEIKQVRAGRWRASRRRTLGQSRAKSSVLRNQRNAYLCIPYSLLQSRACHIAAMLVHREREGVPTRQCYLRKMDHHRVLGSKELHAFASLGIARSQRAADRSRSWESKECRPHRTTIRAMIRREQFRAI